MNYPVLWQQCSGISDLINVLRFFGFFGDTENTELPEQKVHRGYKCLLSYGTCAPVPLVWCVVDYNETRPSSLMARPGYW